MRLGRRHRGQGHLGDLPLTSLIDVVFLLLIFFLVTSDLTTRESLLSSSLQVGTQSGRGADLQPQIVSVERGGDGNAVFRLGDRLLVDKASLTAVLRQLPQEGGVFVRAAGNVPVEATTAALQACKDAGFKRVSYVARE